MTLHIASAYTTLPFLFILQNIESKMTSQAPWCQQENIKTKTWLVGILLGVLYRTIEIISDFIFWLIHKKKEKIILPPIDNLLLLESASGLAKKIRTQKVGLIFQKLLQLYNKI